MKKVFSLSGKVWLYSSPGSAWHFVTLPKEEGAYIKEMFDAVSRGFGSLKVEVTIGKTSWLTSIFPDKKRGSYLLPLKAAVRKKESIKDGDTIRYSVKIVV